jgi:hypothetical protein
MLAWCFLAAGVMGLSCGGVLTGWSLLSAKPHLWNIGLPILLGGQAGLLIGLVLQLQRMWQNSKAAAHRMAHVDERLDELRHTTELLAGAQSAPSTRFYAHLAQAASPRLLMADLKGQLDLLAARISDRK